MSPSEARALLAVTQLREPTANELAAQLGLTHQGARYQLRSLVAQGAVRALPGKPVRYAVAELADAVLSQGVEPPRAAYYLRGRIAGKRRIIARLQREIEALERELEAKGK